MAATYEEVLREIDKRKRAKASAEKAGPGVLASLYRGMAGSAAKRTTNPTGLLTDASKSRQTIPETTYSGETLTPFSLSMTDEQYNEARNQNFGPDPIDATGIDAPRTASARIAERVGESLPDIAMGLPIAAPIAAAAGVGPLAAIVGEMAIGTLGATAAETIAEVGGGPGSQIAGEIIATAAAPIAAPARIARRVGKASARGANRAALGAAEKIASKYGFEPESAVRAAAELKRKIARGVNEPEKYVDQAIQKLGEDIEDFGEITPTLAQSVNREGGHNIASLELNYARQDQDYAAGAAGRRLDVQEQLGAEFDAQRPKGSYDTAREAYEDARSDAIRSEREAWANVPFDEIEPLDTAGLKKALKDLRGGPKAGQRYIPNEASVIDEFGSAETLDEIQALRSELLDTQRAGGRFGATDDAIRRSKRVAPLLQEIDKMLDTLPEAGGDAYRKARTLTRENKALFDPSSKAIEAITERTDPAQLVKRITSAGTKDSVGEARRIASILRDTDGGIESLQSVFIDELIGESLGSRTARQMSKAIDSNPGVYREIFGESGYDFLRRTVRKQRVAQTGKAGTAAQSASVGSGQSAVEQLLSLATDARSPLWSASSRMARHVADSALSREEVVALIRLASQDIRLAKALLEVPTPRAEPAWRVIFDLGVKRAQKEAAATAGRNAARRAGENEATE